MCQPSLGLTLVLSICQTFVQQARELWVRMSDPQHEIPMLHDGYLKLFQLSKPEAALSHHSAR
jgi:hypothetical protein